MKKLTLFLSAMLLACATNLRANEVTFGTDWNTLFGTKYTGSFNPKNNALTLSGSVDDVTLEAKNGTSTNGYVKTGDFRAYNGYTITITAPAGKVLTALSSTVGGKTFTTGIAANVGTLSISNNTISWTGASNSVVLTISGTVSFATIVATYGDAGSVATLKSLVITETEGETLKKQYVEGESFDVTGLTVTANYSDNSSNDVTDDADLEWTITPEVLTAGTTSVTVKATLNGITSAPFVVENIVVTAQQPGDEVTVTFVAGTDMSTDDKTTITKNGITLTATTFDNPSYYQTYANETFKASSTQGKIKSIVFTCTVSGTTKYGPGNYSVPKNGVGTYTYEKNGPTGTWTGSATEVVLSASAQVRMTKVVVTYEKADPNAPNAPTISGESTFHGSTEVTITAGENLKIYYTTNGDEPTTASTLYTAPFPITATTTVKAIAVNETTSSVSDVAEKTFTHKDAVTLAAIDYTTDGTKVFLQPVTVVYANDAYTYLKDETGVGLLYGGNFNLTAGDMVAGIAATTKEYNNLPELLPTVTFEELTVTSGVAPSPAEAKAVPTAEEVNTYLLLKGVTLAADAATTKDTKLQNVTVTFKDGMIDLRDQFKVVTDGTIKAGSYDVEGFVSVYDTTVQFYITKITSTATAIDNAAVETPALKTIENGQLVILRDGVKYNAMGVRLQ